MDIYLVQHAQAKTEQEDPRRPLSEEGRAAIAKVARRAAALGLDIDSIYHSGKLRAKETADVLAAHLGLSDRVREREGLAPLDDVEPVARWLEEQAQEGGGRGIMLVGHLPFLDKLASRLVIGNEAAGVLAFQHASIAKLIPKANRMGFSVQWILTPDLA